MKKILLLCFISLLLSATIFAQHKERTNLRVYKTQPGLLLEGTGAFINFNNGDLLLTQSTNKLSLTGGVLDLASLPTIGGVSLSALYTSGDITLGANNITMTGSIAATANRVTKGWFTNLEVTNLPTVNGTSIHTTPVFTGNTGVGTTTIAYHKLSVISARSTNLNALNITMSDLNKIRTDAATSRDTSSVNIVFTYTGSPMINVVGKTGNTLMKADSTGFQAAVAVTVLPGDTTVAKAYGKLVFKTTDSTLYVCKFIRPTGKKCWFKLDN